MEDQLCLQKGNTQDFYLNETLGQIPFPKHIIGGIFSLLYSLSKYLYHMHIGVDQNQFPPKISDLFNCELETK